MKTVMQELIQWINHNDKYDAPIEAFDIVIKAIKLLEKEKEQIQKSYKDHHDLGHIYGLDTEKYYNQTYNQ
ncbi:hypothetical protein UFOVP753_58 [uncultured Caudovirales phage]|uniref:Uncharacterized protein n=1 Tax=uncultured Caudovirales phage TaxID=2100421 RepID=A0A6J7X6B8_9CAUD|nr:hypothetical protein UFOVP753_58 [uncultured Caudovirales phage]